MDERKIYEKKKANGQREWVNFFHWLPPKLFINLERTYITNFNLNLPAFVTTFA